MWERECRLTRASRYFGGGDGGGGQQLFTTGEQAFSPSGEKRALNPMTNWIFDRRQRFANQDPLLSKAQTGAQDFWSQYPAMQQQLQGYIGDVGNYRDQLAGYQSDLGGYRTQLGGYGTQVGQQYTGLADQFRALQPGLNLVSGTVANEGALSLAQGRDASQRFRNINQSQGNLQSMGAAGQELLDRDAYRQQRFNTALQQQQGLVGQQAALRGQAAGLLGQQAGITGQQAGITGAQAGLSQAGAGLVGQQAGLLGQEQSMQTSALNQLLGTAGSITSNFMGPAGSILNYVQNRSGQNIAAQVAQMQAAAQQDASKTQSGGSIVGGGLGALGAIIPAVIGL